ncbi:hypothetical protein GCK32_004955 [Trichostrongylus colubriformis]|uniref:Secreted protein n=1 Tax=Trichostrongylus colubriformis TaxID=6319 RepID=A0AAN8F511_TRICO
MISPLLLSLAVMMPIVSSILSSSQDSQLMNLIASSRGASEGYPEWILQASRNVKKTRAAHRVHIKRQTTILLPKVRLPSKTPTTASRRTPLPPSQLSFVHNKRSLYTMLHRECMAT